MLALWEAICDWRAAATDWEALADAIDAEILWDVERAA